MLGILADHANDATPADDFAFVANFLDGGTDLHDVSTLLLFVPIRDSTFGKIIR